jgi:hypothetical protein
MSGSQYPVGPDWWQASDGLWYPPTQTPGPSTPATPSTGGYQPYPSGGPSPGAYPNNPGFFGRLFDMSMTRFITPSLVKILFIVAIVVQSLYALVALAWVLDNGPTFLVLGIPVMWFIGVLYSRVIAELIVVFFRIEENTRGRRP